MSDLHGRTAVVTGGTRGIGKAISLALASGGAAVCAVYARDREKAEAFEREAKERGLAISTIRGDLAHDETFDEVVASLKASFDSIDVLVHSAASGVHRPAMDLSDRQMRWTFEINFIAVHRLTRALIGQMRRGGRIIGITSPGGTQVIPRYAAVGASKAALESLFRHYAQELAPAGITVNLVCPGLVITDAVKALPEFAESVAQTRTRTPTGSLTSPEQVASLVTWLCSPEASQINGETIRVDGGKGLLA